MLPNSSKMDATTAQTSQIQAQPLADRSTNTHLGQNQNQNNDTMKNTQNQSAYVSPSDDIMSPCTKKLSDIKGKRFKNAGKPQSLFAKLGKKNLEQSSMAATNNKNKDSTSSTLA